MGIGYWENGYKQAGQRFTTSMMLLLMLGRGLIELDIKIMKTMEEKQYFRKQDQLGEVSEMRFFLEDIRSILAYELF